MFYQLRDLLPKTINQKGLGDILQASSVLHRWPKIALRYFPTDFIEKTTAKTLKNGILTIQLRSHSHAQLIYGHQLAILRDFNKDLTPRQKIKKIRFQVTE